MEEDLPGGPGTGGGGDLRIGQGPEGLRLRAAEEGQQQPLAKGPAGRHGLRRDGQGGGGRQALEAGLREVEGVDQDELFLGAGHGYIKDPLLLRQVLPAEGFFNGNAGQGGIADLPLQVHPAGAQAQGGMHQDGGVEVLAGEGVVQVRQDDDGKLQALGLVDAHEADAVCRGAGRGRGGLPRLQQAAEPGGEGEEAPAAAGFKFLRLAGQGDQVLPALQAAVHGAVQAQEV